MPLVCPIQRTIKVNNGHLLSPGMCMRVPWNNSRKGTAVATNIEDERRQGVRPESEFPGGDLTSKAKEAIAREVAYRRKHGLPIAVDLGKGVEFLSHEQTAS